MGTSQRSRGPRTTFDTGNGRIGIKMDLAVKSKPGRTTARPQKRDAAATRERLLHAAVTEFCAKGFSGARTAAIANRAGCNIRMLYHYFGSKNNLYLAALESVYAQLRSREESLDLLHLNPEKGMSALVEFTFDHMLEHQEFIRLIGIENIQRGRFVKESNVIPQAAQPLLTSIETLLRRGQKQGVFRKRVDPLQLYISILSLSYVHVSNKHTLSITFNQDLTDRQWLAARRRHVRDLILGFLRFG